MVKNVTDIQPLTGINILNWFRYFSRPTYKKVRIPKDSPRVTVIQTSRRTIGTFYSEADADTTIKEMQKQYEESIK